MVRWSFLKTSKALIKTLKNSIVEQEISGRMGIFHREKPQPDNQEMENLKSELLQLIPIYHAYIIASMDVHYGKPHTEAKEVFQRLARLTEKVLGFSSEKEIKRKFDEVRRPRELLDDYETQVYSHRVHYNVPFQSKAEEHAYFEAIRPLGDRWTEKNYSWERNHSGKTILQTYIQSGVDLCHQLARVLNLEPYRIEEAINVGKEMAQKINARNSEVFRAYQERSKKVAELMGYAAGADMKVRVIEKTKCEGCVANGKGVEVKLTHQLFVLYSPEELVEQVQKNIPGCCDNLLKYFLERQVMVRERYNWWQAKDVKIWTDSSTGRRGNVIDTYNQITDVFLINLAPTLNLLDRHDQIKVNAMHQTRKQLGRKCFIHSFEEPFIINDDYWCFKRVAVTLQDVMERFPPPRDETEAARRSAERAEAELREKKARKELENFDR